MAREYELSTRFADDLQREAIEKLDFDDVAPIAIYHFADLKCELRAPHPKGWGFQ